MVVKLQVWEQFKDIRQDKHTVRVGKMIEKMDPLKEIYTQGLVGSLIESNGGSIADAKTVKRIELFAENISTHEIYGIIRDLFVALSSDKELIRLANLSNNVITVTTSNKKEDTLVLKRAEQEIDQGVASNAIKISHFNVHNLVVSHRWLDRMDLREGDRVMVSNPIATYLVPPPLLVEDKR